MKDKFIKINIAFKLPVEVAEKVARLSLEISQKEDAFFTLDNLNFYPHVTIYFLEYPAYNSEKIWEKLEDISKNFSPIKFVADGIKISRGYIGMAASYSPELRHLHEAIVRETNTFRENHPREEYASINSEEISQGKKQNIKLYGHSDVLDLYKPHITITRLKNEEAAQKNAKSIQWEIEDFLIDVVGVFKTGENGTCVEKIKEFKLK